MTHKIVFYSDAHTPGGAERVLITLLAGPDRTHWEPALVYHPQAVIAPFVNNEARRLGVRRLPVDWGDGRRVRRAAVELPAVVRYLRAERQAILHANMTSPVGCRYGFLAGALARVPTVATEHLLVNVPRRAAWVQRLVTAGVDRFIAVSEYVARGLRDRFHVPAAWIRVVPNGICQSFFDRAVPADLRTILAGTPALPRVLTVARLDSAKGHEYLLRAAALLPDVVFVLAGDGPLRATVETQARARGLDGRIDFLGNRNDIASLLAGCDLLALPSINEGLPLAVLEAMAAGRPVVASDVGGVGEAVVDGQTGVLVPAADPPSLARAIRSILEDPTRAERLCAAGRSRAQRDFTAETMVARTVAVCEEFLQRRARIDGAGEKPASAARRLAFPPTQPAPEGEHLLWRRATRPSACACLDPHGGQCRTACVRRLRCGRDRQSGSHCAAGGMDGARPRRHLLRRVVFTDGRWSAWGPAPPASPRSAPFGSCCRLRLSCTPATKWFSSSRSTRPEHG